MAKPIATRMFWIGISTMNRITPTPAITVYWRFRYARAPSCTAAEIVRIVSLPGDSASSAREVSTPYATAAPAHTSAMTHAVVRQKAGQEDPPGKV